MASVTRGLITYRGSEAVVQNKVYVRSFRPVAGALVAVAFIGGIVATRHHSAGGGFIAVPLLFGLFNYLLWTQGHHQSIRLGPTGLVVENMFLRHEFAWMAGPSVYVGRGLQVRLPGGQPVSCQAFASSLGAQSSGYEGHQLVLAQIEEERRRIRNQFPLTGSEDEPAPYRWRFQFPDPWLIPVAIAVFGAMYALGVLAGSS